MRIGLSSLIQQILIDDLSINTASLFSGRPGGLQSTPYAGRNGKYLPKIGLTNRHYNIHDERDNRKALRETQAYREQQSVF
jgi:hypothetical protein